MLYSVIGDEIGTSFENQLEVLKKSNIKMLELRKIDNKYLYEIPNEELINYSKQLDGIQISMIDSPIGKGKYTNEFEDKIIDKYIEICHIFNTKYLRIFTDVSSITKYNALAKKSNIVLLIENETNTKGSSYEYLYDLMQKNYSNISLLYDVQNYYRDGVDYIKAYDELKQYIKYVHIRDYNNTTKKYEVIFKGDININRIMSNIEKNVVISLESHLPIIYPNKEECFISCAKELEKWKNNFMEPNKSF